MDYNTFLNLSINSQEFSDVYNSYTENKKKFGGGTIKVKKLINKYFGGNIKKGGDPNDNLFYSLRNDTSSTDVLEMGDYTYNSQIFPSNLQINRS